MNDGPGKDLSGSTFKIMELILSMFPNDYTYVKPTSFMPLKIFSNVMILKRQI